MTNLKTNIFHSTKLRSAWMVLVLFSGSVLGGMMFASITKPNEAQAQSCIDLRGTWCGMGHAKIGGSGSSYHASDIIYCQGFDPAVACPSGYTRAMHAADRRKDGDTGGYFTCVLQ